MGGPAIKATHPASAPPREAQNPPRKNAEGSKKTQEEEGCAEAGEENAPTHQPSDF